MQADELKSIARQALEDLKGVNIVEFDVRDMTSVTDFMVIASGTSDRHVKSLADAVVVACKQAGVKPLGVEGEREGEWVLVDLGECGLPAGQPDLSLSPSAGGPLPLPDSAGADRWHAAGRAVAAPASFLARPLDRTGGCAGGDRRPRHAVASGLRPGENLGHARSGAGRRPAKHTRWV